MSAGVGAGAGVGEELGLGLGVGLGLALGRRGGPGSRRRSVPAGRRTASVIADVTGAVELGREGAATEGARLREQVLGFGPLEPWIAWDR